MLSIFASTKYHQQITEFVHAEFRLEELIRVVDYLDERPIQQANNLLVKEDGVFPLLDWYNQQAPYILPEKLPFDIGHLLGMVFAKLNNFEKTYAYLSEINPSLFTELDFINRMQQGIPIDPSELVGSYSPFDDYRLMHNQAIVQHYACGDQCADVEKIKYFYLEALQTAPNEEYRAYTARHFGLFLLDLGDIDDAVRVLSVANAPTLSEEARTALTHTLCQAWMNQLSIPYDQELLTQIKNSLWEVLKVYEKQQRPVDQALALTDAGVIANYCESWSESLGYFNQAIDLFEKEGLSALAANTQFRKGTLLYTWAQNGNPQFYRPAAESYQQALKVFTRFEAPDFYAEIQHHLGIIFAEIPDEPKKKGIWAAVSSSAFQEALDIYTPAHYPYQYASVCNHYGNALLKYPKAKLTDNVEKALFYFQEALKIRDAVNYPTERSLTLLNYLEAQWHLGMPEDRFESDRYQAMIQAAQEVLDLSPDDITKQIAQEHLEKLAFLKEAYT